MIYNESKFNVSWAIKALGQLGEFGRGKSKHRPRNDSRLFTNGIYPLVQTGEVSAANLYIRNHSVAYNEFGLKQSKIWDKDTLCITIAANIAETALLGYPMCFPDSIVGFNAYPDESSELFMHYVFTYIKKSIQNSASGSIQDNINIDYLTSLQFRIPEKAYQDKVAEILSTLDSKIELNNRINAELEAMAKTVYDYWFVQFDFPDADGRPYKSSGGEMVWNAELKREVPVGWGVKPLSKLLDCNLHTINKKATLSAIKYLDTSSITNNQVDALQELDFDHGSVPSRAQRVIKKNDILFSTVRPNLRHFGIVKNPPDNLIASTGFAVLSNKEDTAMNDFFYMFITSEPNLKKLEAIAASSVSAYPSINYSDILNLLIALPPNLDIVRKLSNTLSTLFLTISKKQEESQQLAELRDWLLPMLMNGQVRVSQSPE